MKTKLQALRTRNTSKYTCLAILVVTAIMVFACGGSGWIPCPECVDLPSSTPDYDDVRFIATAIEG